MNKSPRVSDADLERDLGSYYRAIGTLSRDHNTPGDAAIFTGPRHSGSRTTLLVTAASIAVVTVLAGALILPRLQPEAAGGPPTTDQPSSAVKTSVAIASHGAYGAPSQADRAGLMGSRGFWVLNGSTLSTSTDGGTTWTSENFPVLEATGVQPIVDVYVLDPLHVWSATLATPIAPNTPISGHAKLSVYRTNDGGHSWARTPAPGSCTYPTASLSFSDAENGYMVCADTGTVARTTDGGSTWSVTSTCPGIGGLVDAATSSTLWAAQAKQVSDPKAILSVSRDGGRTCSGVSLPGFGALPSNTLLSVPVAPMFSDPSHGVVAVSVDVPLRLPQVEFFTTADGGNTWKAAIRQVAAHYSQIAEVASVADQSRLVTVAVQHFSVSADAGVSWMDFDAVGLPKDEAVSWAGFTDASHGIALVFVGPGPWGLMTTSDGGRTWRLA